MSAPERERERAMGELKLRKKQKKRNVLINLTDYLTHLNVTN